MSSSFLFLLYSPGRKRKVSSAFFFSVETTVLAVDFIMKFSQKIPKLLEHFSLKIQTRIHPLRTV